jgi:hypothetical protein
MSFPEKPTTKDLSDVKEVKGFPSYNSSMAGGNMVTDKDPNFAGRGSDSEATHDVAAASMTDFGNAHTTPVLPGSEVEGSNKDLDVDEKGKGYSPQPLTWKDCH